MSKRILAMALAFVMIVQTGVSAFAAEQDMSNFSQSVVEALVDVETGEVYSASGKDHVIQQGAIDVSCSYANDIDVNRGNYAWEAAFRERLATAMENCETIVYISDLEISCDEDIFLGIYWDEINMNPQCFYISGYVSYSYDDKDNYLYVTLNYENKYVLEDGSLNKAVLEADKDRYEKRMAEALSYVDDDMTDVEKMLAVHDFIVRECDYDYINYLEDTIPKESYSAFGVMVNNVAVCNGYALAMIDCLNRLGITNIYVSSAEINHAWNMVCLDGNWYHVDATWDDPVTSGGDYVVEGRVRHDNFVLSDEEITATGHKGWSENAPSASNNGAYEDYAFRDASWALNYYDGLWYYIESYYSVVASDITGANKSIVSEDTYYRFMHGIGDAMYLADDKGIYKLSAPDFDTLEKVRIFTEEEDYVNSTLTEFTIKNEQFVVVLRNNDTGTDTRLVLEIEDLKTEPETYTVYFNSNGGSEVDKIVDIEGGTLIVQPQDPVREGYKFLGWYKDAEFTAIWDFATDTVEENVILHAKWELIPVAATSVELSVNELWLVVGDVVVLTATVLPENTTDKTVIWTSSDPTVVTVEDGTINALAEGEAMITVTTVNNLTAVCLVKVVKEFVEVTEIVLSETSINLVEGETATLTASVLPENATNQKLTWASSDPEVATVENGIITAQRAGWAAVYAESVNYVHGYCWVYVTEKSTEVTEIRLNYTEATMEKGDVLTLSATVLPEDITSFEVSWNNDNAVVVSMQVLEGLTAQITALQAGTATITATTDNGLTASCILTVTEGIKLLDVEEGQWYYDAAYYVFDEGLMQGTKTTELGVYFAPAVKLSREMLAQILYAAEGKPQYVADKTFPDLVEGAWYVDAVLWAASNGIVSGYADGNFGVGDNITREQLALMLYKYAELKGYDTTGSVELHEFIDEESVSSWSATALKWAVSNGIISGKSAGDGSSKKIDPQGEAIRAECAVMLMRFMKSMRGY